MGKATKVVLFVALLLVKNVFQEESESPEIDFGAMTPMQMYEYCCKIIMVCHSLWDSPPQYADTDNNEDLYKDIRKAGCVPKDSASKEDMSFWEKVREWEEEVQTKLMDMDGFTILEQQNDGKSIKINLWNVFKIRKFVVCNKGEENMEFETPNSTEINNNGNNNNNNTIPNNNNNTIPNNNNTTNTNSSHVYCDEKSEIGIWINEQIKSGNSLANLMNRLPNILKKIKLQLNGDCCPYAILRDRFEIIHDHVDTIMQLKGVDHYEREKLSGFAWLDVHNMMTRLEYLNQNSFKKKQINSTCCSNWEDQVKSIQDKFQTEKVLIEGATSINTGSHNLTDFQKNLQQNFEIQLNRLLEAEKQNDDKALTTSVTNTQCCDKYSTPIKDIEKLLKDFKTFDFMKRSNKYVFESVMVNLQIHISIQNTQKLSKDEQQHIISLISTCTVQCLRKKKTSIPTAKNNINTIIEHFDKQVQEIKVNIKSRMASIEHIDWAHINETVNGKHNLSIKNEKLDRMLRELEINNKTRANNNIVDTKTTVDLKNDKDLNNCLDKVEQLTEDHKKLSTVYDASVNSRKDNKLQTDATIKQLNDDLKNLTSDNTIVSTTKPPSYIEEIDKLSSLEKELQEISPKAKNYQEAANQQSQQITEFQTNLAAKFSEEMGKINTADSLDSQIKNKIESRIDELESKFNEATTVQVDNASYDAKIKEKIVYLEDLYNKLKSQHKSKEQQMLQNIDDLQNRIKMANDKICNAEAAANKCTADCDLGELPSIDELLARLNALKSKLKLK